MKTKLILLTTAIVSSTVSFSQTLQEAITKSENERYQAAAADFRSLISKEASKGDNYFYYGENFFKKGDLDSANMYYQKGVELNATYPLNYVGLGKVLWYKGKSADAKTQFFKAATLGANKNTEVMRKTAEAYINSENKNLDEAITILNAAIKIEPKNADNYLLMGDALLEKNPTEGGPAIKQYDKFTELNPKSPKGILRAGKLYQRGRNYQLALDLYKKAETIDPTYAPAYREKAELYHMAGQKANAVESYKKYLELNNSDEARERYSAFIFNNKQYAEAISEIEKLQSGGNSSLYLDRYLGYSYAELGNKTDTMAYKKGLNAINKFFEKSSKVPNFKYVATDYKYKGMLLSKTGQDSVGVAELEKAIILDSKMTNDLLREIAKVHMKSKKYDKAISTFEKIMAGDPKNLTAQDWYEFGRAYYYNGGAKQREKKDMEATESFVKADTCFSKLSQVSPTYSIAYFWRGKANVQQDLKDEKGLAKPHYEKAISLVKPEEKASVKSNIIEAYLYLGSHYAFSKEKDLAKAKEYFNLVKELDPANKAANDFFKSPAGK
ncbi:MAG: tetratricopeptide repeat protein [Burkholderiales bacterium]|nr:tetratricopeptide repeat protein [Bacteroidia bacterium]